MFNEDAMHNYPYASRRNVIHAKNGMVATSEPKAAQVGIDILKKGGNAVDAAIATAAALTVVEPNVNGIGGDAFAIVYMKGKIHGLNASGKSPEALSLKALKTKGLKDMPKFGLTPITVPGVPSAWVSLSEKFGNLSLKEVLEPAAEFAEKGYAVSPSVAKGWQRAFSKYKELLKDEQFKPFFKTFTKDGNAPFSGDVVTLKHHAKTLRTIGETNGKDFYQGEIADKIDAFSRKHGGFIRKSDLINHSVEWVTPIEIEYQGYRVLELPPNTQGMVTLEALGILRHFKNRSVDDIHTLHKHIESIKIAFEDGKKWIGDPLSMQINEKHLLDSEYLLNRSKEIGENAQHYLPGSFKDHGTVYLSTADKEGNMVSYIQSNYMGFGSGIAIPETGIAMSNRGHNFSFDLNSQNVVGPNKRPFNTIIPGFLMKGNVGVGPFGVMGGFMQPQAHMQVITSMIDFGLNPQAALDRPRWQWVKEKTLMVEATMPIPTIHALERKGHVIKVMHTQEAFGRGQIIVYDEKRGVYTGGTEPRCDGFIASY
jgi:gamma-glutamyltranspeptidase/glutathione hydrolase